MARLSARERPVTVMQLPSIRLFWCRYLSTAGVPPTCREGRGVQVVGGERRGHVARRQQQRWETWWCRGRSSPGCVNQPARLENSKPPRPPAPPPTHQVHILHDVLARGLEVGDEGDAVRHALEVVQGELKAAGAGHGDQVQHCGGGGGGSE